jgi:hypothetical protein
MSQKDGGFMIKILLAFGLAVVFCLPVLGEEVPNLVGNWTRTDVNGVIYGNPLEGTSVDIPGNISWLNMTNAPFSPMIVIKEQKGSAFAGMFIPNPLNRTIFDPLIGVIGDDNRSIYMEYEDIYAEANLISPSEISMIIAEKENKGIFLANIHFSKTN